ncbi:MAG: type I-E CRISPR-associated protein Cas6/Cse3/CasE [Anaerolineales bacterium]|nr:type I-E CRISPR-associated protein Cas6/Cse3/CasE [Anaerolineales bacterium]
MYLSKLLINPRSRQVQSEIANPYQMHRTLMQAFPDNLREHEERVLFRLDSNNNGALILLVQSWEGPNWSKMNQSIQSNYLLDLDNNPAVKLLQLELSAGQYLSFRLRANPTIKRKFPNGQHKRVGLYNEDQQIEWLQRKGEQGGFRLNNVRITDQDDVKTTIKRQETKHQLKMTAVRFDGYLQVIDVVRLQDAVRNGIGSGKGLGFGLLSLAPASV